VVDWFSRRVLSHRVSITMEAEFCIEALQEALAKHGKPESFRSGVFKGAAKSLSESVWLDAFHVLAAAGGPPAQVNSMATLAER
jgi:putative transposase